MIDEYVKKWIIKALEDFKLVSNEMELPEEKIATSPVCFHCQQVVEKLLKAYLVFKNVNFGKTHDLKLLLKLCREKDSEFDKLKIGNLNFYSVQIRYPDEFYIPTIQETKENYKITEEVKKFVLNKMGISEKDLK